MAPLDDLIGKLDNAMKSPQRRFRNTPHLGNLQSIFQVTRLMAAKQAAPYPF